MSFRKWMSTSMAHDSRVCAHIFGKIPASLHGWRPSPSQRSVEELARYLAICGINPLRGFLEPGKGWREIFRSRIDSVPAEELGAAFEQQAQEIEAYFQEITDEQLETNSVTMPWGETMSLGQAIVYGPAKWLPSYRMQLFLYARQNDIVLSTPNLWHGKDRPAT